jgi:YesN/AraC family two-component response regulator
MKKYRLLVIDDEPSVGESLQSALEGEYEVDACESAEEGWDLLFQYREPFDLLIVDLTLSGMDGLEFIKRVREINPILPCLIITGHSTKEKAEEACNLGVSGYIAKPFDIDALKQRIKKALSSNKGPGVPCLNQQISKDVRSLHPITVAAITEIHKVFPNSLSLDELAERCDTSKFHLARVFKKDCGIAIHRYITMLRIERAKALLLSSRYPVATIVELIGYKDKTRFFKSFKRMTGTSPQVFRSLQPVYG